MAKQSVTVKLPKELVSKIDEECEGLGCNRTDFIQEAAQEKIEGPTDEPDEQEIKYKPEPKPKKPYRIILDDEPAIGTINTGRDGSKAQLISIQANGAQIWKQIEEPKPTVTLIDEPKPTVVFHLDAPQDPKTIDNSRLPPIQMIRDITGKISLYAKRYNT